MTTVSIRELHNQTGKLVRKAASVGEIRITDHGRVVAKIVPQSPEPATPYFARRRPSSAFTKLDQSGKTGPGLDITELISNEREDRV